MWRVRNMLIFLQRGVVGPTHNSLAGGPPLIGYPRQLNLPTASWGRALPWWQGGESAKLKCNNMAPIQKLKDKTLNPEWQSRPADCCWLSKRSWLRPRLRNTRPYFKTPCGGGLEYLHLWPASRKRRRKGNPVPGGITGPPCSRGI
jgi:hypothetical protein